MPAMRCLCDENFADRSSTSCYDATGASGQTVAGFGQEDTIHDIWAGAGVLMVVREASL